MKLDEMSAWKRKLSLSEVEALYYGYNKELRQFLQRDRNGCYIY